MLFAFAKVPVPLLDQVKLGELDVLAPVVIFTAPVLEQVATGFPATATGG